MSIDVRSNDSEAFEMPPLGREEARKATEVAIASIDRRRVRVYGAELHVEKDEQRRARRLVSIVLADLEPYLPYVVIVDPETGSAVKVDERPDLVIPFSDDEIGQARAIARAEADLAEGLDRRQFVSAVFYPTAHGHDDHDRGAGSPARRVGLAFFDDSDEGRRPVARVIVDIGLGRVTSVDRDEAAP
jgi:hypothetical protein